MQISSVNTVDSTILSLPQNPGKLFLQSNLSFGFFTKTGVESKNGGDVVIQTKLAVKLVPLPTKPENQRDLIVEAKDKMIFRCGRSSIELNANGEIILKGKAIYQQGEENIKLISQRINLN